MKTISNTCLYNNVCLRVVADKLTCESLIRLQQRGNVAERFKRYDVLDVESARGSPLLPNVR